MLNAIPFIGHLLDFVLKTSMAIPFWIAWTWGGLGAKYFYFLPDTFKAIPFWHCVGLFIIFGILNTVLPWPKLVSISNDAKVQ